MLKDAPVVSTEELLAKAKQPAADAMRLHPFYHGKVQTALRCRVRDFNDFAIWYTPGVAAPCKAIQANPELVYEYTHKWNTVAIVSDGTRVLGLGDIGPKAGLPVMEGKALLYKYLGGVDAWPIMLDTKDPDKIIDTVLTIQPGFGGVNLEDISQPKCFRVLDTLRERAEIPIWHDDQQGTAMVTLAGLINALKIVGKKISEAKIAFVGCGAANVACSRLIFPSGATPALCTMVDSKGILNKKRADIEKRKAEYIDKWRLCQTTNAEQREGGIAEALVDADVVIALSTPGPNTLQADWIRTMAQGRDRVCVRESHSRNLAVGGQSGRGRRRRHGPIGFSEPGEQLARLPGPVPRHAGCARQDHHRRNVHGGRARAGRHGGGERLEPRVHSADDGRVGRLPARSRGGRRESRGAGRGGPCRPHMKRNITAPRPSSRMRAT